MIKFCKSREICTATKCFTSQQFNWHLAFEQFFYSTLKIDWLFSNQMADSLWKSRPEFIPSIVVYSIAFVVSLDIFIVKNQTTNLSSASYTCHCTIYIVNREQKHSTTSQNTFDKFLGEIAAFSFARNQLILGMMLNCCSCSTICCDCSKSNRNNFLKMKQAAK